MPPAADPPTSGRPRRVPLALATLALVVVVLLVALSLLVVRLVSNDTTTGPPPTPRAPAALVAEASGVPATTLDAVGAPGEPTTFPPVVISQHNQLTQGGIPEVLYVGAEFCPFCAAERWPLVVALSRFGHFEDLGEASSGADLVFPSLPSFSFRGSHYRSRYLRFSAVETYSSTPLPGQLGDAPLERLPAATKALLARQDRPPLAAVAGSLPFVDLAGRALVIGAGFSPGVLSGLSAAQVAADLAHPDNPVAQAIDGAANELTAVLCQATGGHPGAVCQSPGVREGATRLTGAAAPPEPAVGADLAVSPPAG